VLTESQNLRAAHATASARYGSSSELLTYMHVAACCSVLQYVTVCCSALHYIYRSLHQKGLQQRAPHLQACCSVLQCVAACCSIVQCVAVSYNKYPAASARNGSTSDILKNVGVAACCSVLQRVAVYYRSLHCVASVDRSLRQEWL